MYYLYNVNIDLSICVLSTFLRRHLTRYLEKKSLAGLSIWGEDVTFGTGEILMEKRWNQFNGQILKVNRDNFNEQKLFGIVFVLCQTIFYLKGVRSQVLLEAVQRT